MYQAVFIHIQYLLGSYIHNLFGTACHLHTNKEYEKMYGVDLDSEVFIWYALRDFEP